MPQHHVPRIKVTHVKLGYSRLADDSLIIHRVAVVDIRVIRAESPFGAEFEVGFTTGISVHPSKKALEEFKDKRILAPGENPPPSWRQLDIVDRKPAVEEVEFVDERLGRYAIRVEVEPVMASVNTEVRNIRGEPLYVVRWAPKVSWKEIKTEG